MAACEHTTKLQNIDGATVYRVYHLNRNQNGKATSIVGAFQHLDIAAAPHDVPATEPLSAGPTAVRYFDQASVSVILIWTIK